MEWILDVHIWIALITLTALEIVLGIDNIIFITILAGKLPAQQRARARTVGLSLALIGRVVLLLSIAWVMGLTRPLLTIRGFALSGRDIILILGGLFLIAKSVDEIHAKLEGKEEHHAAAGGKVTFSSVIGQILLLDIVFSLDSVITAVGMAKDVPVMIAAVVIAILIMLAASGPISEFVERRPTIKMLALAFLVLIGVNLLAEGFHQHIERGYTYFAMAFAVAVEMLNLRVRGTMIDQGGQDTPKNA
jgi:predicted tellurium resistance membrane protein TerC